MSKKMWLLIISIILVGVSFIGTVVIQMSNTMLLYGAPPYRPKI